LDAVAASSSASSDATDGPTGVGASTLLVGGFLGLLALLFCGLLFFAVRQYNVHFKIVSEAIVVSTGMSVVTISSCWSGLELSDSKMSASGPRRTSRWFASGTKHSKFVSGPRSPIRHPQYGSSNDD
jgi:hypothetical protein